MIKESKDYETLYQLILDGNIVPAFVDYNFRGEGPVVRDVCKIQRRGDYEISIGVRGMCYVEIYPFNQPQGDEKELFIKDCQNLNLGWVGDKEQ